LRPGRRESELAGAARRGTSPVYFFISPSSSNGWCARPPSPPPAFPGGGPLSRRRVGLRCTAATALSRELVSAGRERPASNCGGVRGPGAAGRFLAAAAAPPDSARPRPSGLSEKDPAFKLSSPRALSHRHQCEATTASGSWTRRRRDVTPSAAAPLRGWDGPAFGPFRGRRSRGARWHAPAGTGGADSSPVAFLSR
jgi:hypothetical protein